MNDSFPKNSLSLSSHTFLSSQSSARLRYWRHRERRHLIEKTPVAHPDRFRMPVTRQGNVIAATTAAEHLAAVSAMVSTSHHREPCLTRHATGRVVVRDPGWRSFHALLATLGYGRRCKHDFLSLKKEGEYKN